MPDDKEITLKLPRAEAILVQEYLADIEYAATQEGALGDALSSLKSALDKQLKE